MRNLKKVTIVMFLLSLISAHAQGFNDIEAGLSSVQFSSTAWGDYDNDGDQDVLIMGLDDTYSAITELYRNDGSNSFVKIDDLVIPGIYYGDVIWIDYDNDGDLDIFIMGYLMGGENITKIYKNTGNNTFEETNISFLQLADGNLSSVDFNNDGYLDVTISGYDGNSEYISKLYKNDGNSNYILTTIEFPGVFTSVFEWADYDNDGDMDLILAGNSLGPLLCKLYENNGDETFTETSDVFPGFFLGDLAWGDYNSDGYLDLLLSGFTEESERVVKVYKNNGDKTFTELINTGLVGVSHSSTIWGDYDNDGDLDIFTAGNYEASGSWPRVTDIFINNGDDTFTAAELTFTADAYWGESAFADFNNDGNIDLILTGNDDAGGCNSIIYENDNTTPNSIPLPPTTLTTSVNGNQVTMSWNEGSDSETPTLGLSYNLLLHRENGEIVFNSNSNEDTGSRLIPSLGNVGSNLTWTIKDLEDGNYYWAVQCIDYNFISSSFTDVETFTIQDNGVDDNYELQITNYQLKQNYPNPFNPHTKIRYELEISNYESAEIVVYNNFGQMVWSSQLTALSSQITGSILFDGSKFNSGIYYYSLVVDGKKLDTKSMILIK